MGRGNRGAAGFEFVGAALLNDPHLTEMPAAIAFDRGACKIIAGPIYSLNGGEKMNVEILNMLGLAEGATDEEIIAAIREISESVDEIETLKSELSAAKSAIAGAVE